MKQYQPYTYYIKWSKTGIWYYGVEYAKVTKIANPKNLWSEYFTSSHAVEEYRKLYGEPDIKKITKVFADEDSAIAWESRFLSRVDAKNNPTSLNGHNSDGLKYKNKIVTEEARYKMSIAGKGRSKSEEHKRKISEARKKYYETVGGLEWKNTLSIKAKQNNPSKKGNVPWNKGLKNCFNETTIEKMSARQKEIKNTSEYKQQQSERCKSMWETGIFDNRPKPTKEQIVKRAESIRGFKQSDYQKQRASETMKGRKKSLEEIQKLKDTLEKKKTETKMCDHCGYQGYGSTFTRYHGNNCRFK